MQALGVENPDALPMAALDWLAGDLLGEWLPLALADLAVGLVRLGGGKCEGRAAFLDSWGLQTMAGVMRTAQDADDATLEITQWGMLASALAKQHG